MTKVWETGDVIEAEDMNSLESRAVIYPITVTDVPNPTTPSDTDMQLSCSYNNLRTALNNGMIPVITKINSEAFAQNYASSGEVCFFLTTLVEDTGSYYGSFANYNSSAQMKTTDDPTELMQIVYPD